MRLALAFAAIALIAAPTFADAAKKPAAKPTPVAAGTVIPAPNGKGCINSATKKFAKCPPVVAVKVTVPTAADVAKDKNGKCHWKAGKDKGKFVKCP